MVSLYDDDDYGDGNATVNVDNANHKAGVGDRRSTAGGVDAGLVAGAVYEKHDDDSDYVDGGDGDDDADANDQDGDDDDVSDAAVIVRKKKQKKKSVFRNVIGRL